MEITPLGNTGLKVTKMGLGLAALGRPGYINIGHDTSLGPDKSIENMEVNAHKVLDTAWENGIRYIDTARSYGHAEVFLSSWLKSRSIKPAEITISSKWGYVYTADWQVDAEYHEIKYHTLENFNKQWKESRDILGSYISLYQIHSATLDSGVLNNAQILNALTDLKNRNISIGLSLSGSHQADTLQKAMDIVVDGQRLFDSVQLTWNILEQSTSQILRQAHDDGMGVIVKEAMANGRLFDYHKHVPELSQEIDHIIRRQGTTPDAMALAFVSQQPFVDTVLSGASSVNQLKSNLTFTQTLLESSFVEMLSKMSEKADLYWKRRTELKWN